MEDSIVLMEDSINDEGENTATDNDEMIDLLRQSPFAPLLEIDGVTPESLISSFASAFGDSDSSIDPSVFGEGSVPGSDPFVGFGDPTAVASPLTGGVNPWAVIDTEDLNGGDSLSGGMPSSGGVGMGGGDSSGGGMPSFGGGGMGGMGGGGFG
ncbi:hypothetical protein [Nodularia sp. LEGE 04288]|uniref:hypothetical protein n=1 Tax=Nodularia sp. LEGE 04288 TaxID=1828639 RepID=UPI001D0FE02E|nr:hypothetical protein [Nodularia sp. LEGE 04288]MCC2692404.1 hypothetical protein [Nodularia sp. LEGE 04288]